MNKQSFINKKKFIIGVIHFLPLPGYKGSPDLSTILEKAMIDLRAYEKGGVDAVIVENNYDLPHKINVGPETVSAMTFLTSEMRKVTKLPLGVSILWNDYKAALSIAKTCGGSFIRIPVFVDTVKTNYGVVKGEPRSVIRFKKRIKADNIDLFVDIHVKHSKLLSKKNIECSAIEAIKNGADAVIITGKWTSDPPSIKTLRFVRASIPNSTIIIGSGATRKNIGKLMQVTDGVIVSTSLKEGLGSKKEINIKSYNQRINYYNVKKFVKEFNRACDR
ncbi:MAG: BtpA/SgcQ family protein [Candidatus Woesebacteria bacterium]|jgi:membrane complex biogenesis BtpA family protein